MVLSGEHRLFDLPVQNILLFTFKRFNQETEAQKQVKNCLLRCTSKASQRTVTAVNDDGVEEEVESHENHARMRRAL
jgi:hypothetical protein